MDKHNSLLELLKIYQESDVYPFHMPGHKRRVEGGLGIDFPNPFSIDITEIEGFDNLHHPEGILKASMKWAAYVYGADRLYYLVNGSSGGILSAICAVTKPGGRIVMSRNCHKSAYHGIILNQLQVEYAYPQIIDGLHLLGGIRPEDVRDLLEKNDDIEAVFLVSPTYEGIVSDIKAIADIVHSFHIPLIVDEAHGAHFIYGDDFPESAIHLGADLVIQSLHKTLPSLTQTAVMLVREGFVDVCKIEYYLQVFQSSSPSYVLMASMENCIRVMNCDGRGWMAKYGSFLKEVRSSISALRHLKLLDTSRIGAFGIFDMDISKIVVSTVDSGLDGMQLSGILRKKYGLEMEMNGPDYVIALTSVMDTQKGLERLVNALQAIDNRESERYREADKYCNSSGVRQNGQPGCLYTQLPENGFKMCYGRPDSKILAAQAVNGKRKKVYLRDSAGEISGEFIYLYPPGIPVIVPGEVIGEEILVMVLDYIKHGLPVQGLMDKKKEYVEVVDV